MNVDSTYEGGKRKREGENVDQTTTVIIANFDVSFHS